jgi:hypothetical protein
LGSDLLISPWERSFYPASHSIAHTSRRFSCFLDLTGLFCGLVHQLRNPNHLPNKDRRSRSLCLTAGLLSARSLQVGGLTF